MKKLRVTVYIAELTCVPETATTMLFYSQQLLHGDMPLPTLEGMLELLNTGNPEARNIIVRRVPDDKDVAAKLAEHLKDLCEVASNSELLFEPHVFDVRKKKAPRRRS